MNYLAHGRNSLDAPYELAGTAVPDWLSVVDRRVRARARLANPYAHDGDPIVRDVARGVLRHHHDDGWFHQTRAFAELSLALTRDLGDTLPEDDGFRRSFLGHILVEILLDAALIEQDVGRLQAYYSALEQVDPLVVGRAVDRMATRPARQLPHMIRLFCRDRFLYDYRDDAKLLVRLNRVMRRVRLPQLPQSMCDFLHRARRPVRERISELLDDSGALQGKENCS